MCTNRPSDHESEAMGPDHKTSQLSPEEANAIEFLVAGLTDAEVATRLGKARETITRWRGRPAFVAALNSRHQEIFESATVRLRNLALEAVDVLTQTLRSANSPKLRMEVAIHVLRSTGLSDVPPPSGARTPEEVEREQRDAEAARTLRLMGVRVDPANRRGSR